MREIEQIVPNDETIGARTALKYCKGGEEKVFLQTEDRSRHYTYFFRNKKLHREDGPASMEVRMDMANYGWYIDGEFLIGKDLRKNFPLWIIMKYYPQHDWSNIEIAQAFLEKRNQRKNQ